MKRYHIISVLTITMLMFSMEGFSRNTVQQNDSTVNAVKVQTLRNRRSALQKQIAAEDKKRNAVIEGVSPETMELRNERQDSVCLELRSELTAVNLQLKELGADNQLSHVVQQYNHLFHPDRQDSAVVTAPVSPAVPARKEQ